MKSWQAGLLGVAVGAGFILLFGGILYVAMRDATPSPAIMRELLRPSPKEIERIKKGVVYAIPPAEQRKDKTPHTSGR